MAKKISGVKTSAATVAAVYDRRSSVEASPRRSQTAATKPAKFSACLDTRVVYCDNNLKAPGRRQNDETSVFPNSLFSLLPWLWPASHYVKVMPDQIFGDN
jgi:hypothetical protein